MRTIPEVCTAHGRFRFRSTGSETGFSLVEFMISTLVILLIAASVFTMLAQIQRASSYQTEIQSVMDNTRLALDIVTRCLRQAGNDPYNTGLDGLAITSSTQVRARSDLTGSAGPGEPDKGDPDGDTSDSGEDLVIRYNATARSIEMVPNGGTAQTIASNISAFAMSYWDAAGGTAASGAAVRRVTVTVTGATTLADPQTGQTFSMQMASDVQIATRQ